MENNHKHLIYIFTKKMAQLTLQQRGQMASDGLFHQRLIAAVKKTATYWAGYTVNLNNVAIWKRRKFASEVQTGTLQNAQAYAEFLLSVYNVDPPIMDGSQLADSELTDSFASANAYDYFAGVVPADV